MHKVAIITCSRKLDSNCLKREREKKSSFAFVCNVECTGQRKNKMIYLSNIKRIASNRLSKGIEVNK